LVNPIHPRRHLFIRLTARGDSIAATPFLHSAGSVTAPPSLHLFGRRIDRRATTFSAGRPISSRRHNLFSGPANLIAVPQSLQWAGESIAMPQLFHSGPVNHIAAPQSFQRAGESHRRAAIFSAGRRITSPRRKHFSRTANPIAAPHSFQRSGESHRRANINNNNNNNNNNNTPRHNLFHRPAHLIAMLQSFQPAGKPNRFRGPAHSIAKPPNLISAGTSSSCLLYHGNSI